MAGARGGSGAARRFYDERFAHEAEAPPAPLAAPTRIPTDRYQAGVSLLPSLIHGGAILELGAGSGRLARSLAAAGLRFDTYTVSDLSEARLARLRRDLFDPSFQVRQLDIEDPPEELTGSFDAVLLVALIEHLFDPIGALRNVRRMLRPGGLVYVDTPNIAKYTRRLKLLAGRFPSTSSLDEGLRRYDGAPVRLHDEGHLHYFTFRSLSRILLEHCGFERVRRLPYASGTAPLPARLAHVLARLWPGLFSEVCLVAYAGDAHSSGAPASDRPGSISESA